MALFVDGPVSCIDDLSAQDSQLLTVASVEGIDVTQKLGLAQDELSMELRTMLARFGYVEQLFWLAPQLRLTSIVVTHPLKLWHTARALEMFYQDAYNSQLNDRYAGKRDQFHALSKWAYEKLIQTGLGIASQPVPRAVTPGLTASGGSLPDGTYYATLAWLNSSGAEGAAATPTAVTIASSAFSVQPGSAPVRVAGWNVYVGPSPDAMFRQNGAPLATGQTWLQANLPLVVGQTPGTGQAPTYFQPLPRIIQRG